MTSFEKMEIVIPQRPPWLDDEPEIVAILAAFLDKLDQKPLSERTRIPSIQLNNRNAPVLFRHDESADRTWQLLRSLENVVFEVRLSSKRRPYDPEYSGATLGFMTQAEAICRDWLKRPRRKRYREEWEAAVQEHAECFADHGTSLGERPVKVSGKSAKEVVEAFARIATFSEKNLTLRQLSARVFWGHSKILDTREDLVHCLYPGITLNARPILVHVRLPSKLTGVLFVENLDTYNQALLGMPSETVSLALVYSSGFRGSAERIRERQGASLHYHSTSDDEVKEAFERWWFDEVEWNTPVWFWGDLDFSGMGILKALRDRFKDAAAWSVGYEKLLELLRNGYAHSAVMTEKSDQLDPINTGDQYADEILLPALRQYGLFVDQEII